MMFVTEVRSKKDIKRNMTIMMASVRQKTVQKSSRCNILRSADASISLSRVPPPAAPRTKSDVYRNSMTLIGQTPLQPPKDAPRSKSDVLQNAMKLTDEFVLPKLQTGKHHLKRKAIDSSSTRTSSSQTYDKNISTDQEHIEESKDSNILCRFCLRVPHDAIKIAWHNWKDSNLALLYEQITNVKLHISKNCSELCCTNCSTKLHNTFQTIQMFREANTFWLERLLIKTEPIEEVKLEQPGDIELIEYLDNKAGHVIFVDEPITVDDGVMGFEYSKVKKTKGNRINDESSLEVSLQSTLIPPIEYELDHVVETTGETTEGTNFECNLCDKAYKTARGLTEHKISIHESMMAHCQLCNKNMSTVYGLQRHMQRSHGDSKNEFECQICGNISNSFNNWKAHQLIHTRSMETITPCDQCGKVFPDNRLMKTHKRITHAPYIASQCNECGKVFRNRKRLAAHMLLHGTPKIQCDHCKTMFKSKKYVIEHMRVVHGQGLPHVCDKCGQEFQNRYLGRKHTSNCIGSVNKLRRRHQRSESNSLNCRICMRPYLMLATLQNHYKVKHKPEEFENLCMQCNQVFESVEACSAHAETAHGLQCTVCKKICLSEAILRAHMEGHFGGKPRFSCEICGGSYARFEYLKMHHRRRHTTERPFKCDGPGCHLEFADNYDLLQHKQTKHAPMSERQHVCIECGARFITATRLRYHMVTHTGIGTFECVQCGEYFRYARQLHTHIIAKHQAFSAPGSS